jgi:hypothetical protein
VSQSRRGSLIEAIINVLIGLGINLSANVFIFSLIGWHRHPCIFLSTAKVVIVTKLEWVNRCARRIQKLIGEKWPQALQSAGNIASLQADENGASGLAWQSPEEAADDYFAGYEDDIEDDYFFGGKKG